MMVSVNTKRMEEGLSRVKKESMGGLEEAED